MSTARDDDRLARAVLSRLAEPGDLRVRRVVAEVGAVEVVELLRAERDLDGVLTDVAQRLRHIDPQRDLDEAAAHGIRYVVPGDAEWPDQVEALDRCDPVDRQGGAPLGLWVRGPLSLAEATRLSVAVVGSRSATTYGADVAGELAYGLAQAEVCVVSGAAFGIDAAAHRGALAAKAPTVAVLACGVDRAYPAGHHSLLEHIAETGVVVSELPPGCAPTRLRFLTRNRVIAALSLAEASHGNAIGVGLADFITRRLRDAIDEQKTFLNAFTTGHMERAKIPATFQDDEELITTIARRYGTKRWLFIPNTLHLETLYASEDLAEELAANPVCEIEESAVPLEFAAGRHQLAFGAS